MAAATAAQIKTALSALLKISEADLASYWTAVCVQAATFADHEVKGRLYRRGFSPTDVALWDRLYEFTLDLGLWKAVMLGGAYSGFSQEVIAALDRRKEADEVLVFVAGEWIRPPSGAAGTTVTAGPRAADSGGNFNYNPADPSGNNGIDW